MLRSSWASIFKTEWHFGLALILLFGIPRFILVLNANETGDYRFVSVIFLAMWLAPVIFLTKQGRARIGITWPANNKWLLYSFLLGILCCSLLYFAGTRLYGGTISNWFVYISRSYPLPALSGSQRDIYFLIYALIGMSFSPVGEELLYRGMIHESFASSVGTYKASLIDSAAFGLTHMAHFGIVYFDGEWTFLPFPALLWVLGMFISSRIFFLCKVKTGSVLGAIASHAGFNLAMMYFIIYFILS